MTLFNFDDPKSAAQMAMGLALISQRRGESLAPVGLLGLNAYNQALEAQRMNAKAQSEGKRLELEQLSGAYKMLKEREQIAAQEAQLAGKPYQPNPQLKELEGRLFQLAGVDTQGGLLAAGPQAPASPPAPGGLLMPSNGGMLAPQGELPHGADVANALQHEIPGPPRAGSGKGPPPQSGHLLLPEAMARAGIQSAPSYPQSFPGGPQGQPAMPQQAQPQQTLRDLVRAAGIPEATALMLVQSGKGAELQKMIVEGLRPRPVGRNERLVDMSTGTPRVALDAAPDLPQGMRMGANGPEWIPGYVEGQGQIRAQGRNQTNVNLPPAEKAFSIELAKRDAKTLDDWRESAGKAAVGLDRVREMKRLASEGVYSGWGASGRTGVANFFETLGLPFDRTKLTNSQAYQVHAKELALSMLKEGVGASQISDADRQYIHESVAQLETSPRARLELLTYLERRLGQSVERFNSADAYARERGGLSGFNYQPKDAPKPQKLSRNQTAIYQARQAIKAGKNRDAVVRRMIEQGFDPAGL